jgi:prepilin-type N-terminal cleavage/methylation domain-containing protein
MQSTYRSYGNSMASAVCRRGFTLLEVVLAAAILAMLLTTSVQMLRALSIHQRGTERREVALEAVQAVADQVANVPWNQLTAESVKKVMIPKPLEGWLPGANLSISLAEEAAPTTSRRIHVEINWNGRDGQAVAPVRLTSWVFPE